MLLPNDKKVTGSYIGSRCVTVLLPSLGLKFSEQRKVMESNKGEEEHVRGQSSMRDEDIEVFEVRGLLNEYVVTE